MARGHGRIRDAGIGRVTGDRLRLTVIGCAPAWSRGPGRPASCYLVEGAGSAVVLDLGQGALGALCAVRDPLTLDAIVVSHLHPDHHVDLVALRHLLRWGTVPPARLALHAPAGVARRYDAFLEEPGFLATSFAIDELAAGSRTIGGLVLEARPVLHGGGAHALRVSIAADPAAPALVYTGDCGRWTDVVPLIRPGDTLLSEDFWGAGEPDPPANHLTSDEAAQAAVAGGARRLVLTHLGEEADPAAALAAATARFPGETLRARPGLVLPLD